jgi:hypothetical protein
MAGQEVKSNAIPTVEQKGLIRQYPAMYAAGKSPKAVLEAPIS